MPFKCNECNQIIDSSRYIREHVATEHLGLNCLYECHYCLINGRVFYYKNYDDLVKHSTKEHTKQPCKAVSCVRSTEDDNKLYSFILKHIIEIEQHQITTSPTQNASFGIGKQENGIDGIKLESSFGPVQKKNTDEVEFVDLTDEDEILEVSATVNIADTDDTLHTLDHIHVDENNELFNQSPPVTQIVDGDNNENVAAVPMDYKISNDRNVDESLVDMTETTANFQYEQSLDSGQNEQMINKSMTDNQSNDINIESVAPIKNGQNQKIVINQLTDNHSNDINIENVTPATETPRPVFPSSCDDLASLQSHSDVKILSVFKMKNSRKANPIVVKEEVPESPKSSVPPKKRPRRQVGSKKRSFYPCSVCGKRFRSNQHAKDHKRVIHDNVKHKCKECGKSYSYISTYGSHIRSHKTGKSICDDCGYKTDFHCHLIIHIVGVHMKNRYKCKLCDKTFGLKGNMKKHLRVVHLKEKPFICDYCDKTFSQKYNLCSHWKCHHFTK